jgi:hypothetical protein
MQLLIYNKNLTHIPVAIAAPVGSRAGSRLCCAVGFWSSEVKKSKNLLAEFTPMARLTITEKLYLVIPDRFAVSEFDGVWRIPRSCKFSNKNFQHLQKLKFWSNSLPIVEFVVLIWKNLKYSSLNSPILFTWGWQMMSFEIVNMPFQGILKIRQAANSHISQKLCSIVIPFRRFSNFVAEHSVNSTVRPDFLNLFDRFLQPTSSPQFPVVFS